MGWLFSGRWLERKELIKHLVENKGGAKVLKHCTVGNNLWLVYEHDDGKRSVGLCMMKGPHNCGKGYTGRDRDWWGYKGVHETSGPIDTSCPVSYLEMCTAPENKYAYEWRQRVYARGRNARALKIGSKWHIGEKIVEIIKRLSPSAFLVELDGMRYRCGISYLLGREAV